MRLFVNNEEYELTRQSLIRTSASTIIIERLAPTLKKPPIERLVIVFDKDRTARWFAGLIVNSLQWGEKSLRIQKIDYWDPRFPFGYKYN